MEKVLTVAMETQTHTPLTNNTLKVICTFESVLHQWHYQRFFMFRNLTVLHQGHLQWFVMIRNLTAPAQRHYHVPIVTT